MTFLRKEQRETHFVVIENTSPRETPRNCKPDHGRSVLTIRFCFPTTDAKGTAAWECGHVNPHGGDVHAQPQ